MAVATVLAALEGVFGGDPFAGSFRYTRFWRKTDRWRVIGGSVARVTSPG